MKLRFWNRHKTPVEKYPIVPAKKLIPTWFKQLPSVAEYYHNHPTIKTCPGIVNYLRTGFIVRTWVDSIIETTDSFIKFSYPNDDEESLLSPKYGPGNYLTTMDAMAFDKRKTEYTEYSHPTIIKWNLEWYCQAPVGYNLLFSPTQFHPNLNFTTIIGITDTRIEESLNVQAAWHPTDRIVFIPAGTPIAQIIPIKREDYQFDVVVGDKNDNNREFIKQTRRIEKQCSFFNEEYFDDSVDDIFNKIAEGRINDG